MHDRKEADEVSTEPDAGDILNRALRVMDADIARLERDLADDPSKKLDLDEARAVAAYARVLSTTDAFRKKRTDKELGDASLDELKRKIRDHSELEHHPDLSEILDD